ncbi:MAG: processing peptidase [Rickettsiaceae bacterium]|jgi:predicted Zn-dependent peptidase|nr:processing peptidase [Rickettsiaceae bacterium]
MQPEIITLPNQLRIVIDQVKSVETAAIAVFVNTGSRNETPEINGISHFLEHMAFKGTKTRNSKQIAEQFDNIGGKINAYTSREKTVYYAKVLKQDIEFATEFLSDILQNSIFDSEELEKERGVILQEIAMTNDTPDDIVFDHFQSTAFPKQAVGRSILGPEKNIKKFNRQDFVNYINKQYNYSNIVVVISGNVEPKKFTSYVKKYFNKLGSNEIKKPEAAKYHGGDFRKYKSLEQINLLLGFRGASYTEEDYYRCQILASILGGGMSSRLFQEVREKRGLAYSVYAFNHANFDSGLFGIYLGTTQDKANEAIEVIGDELLKITNKINDEELKRVLAQTKAGLLMARESVISRSQKLGGDVISFNRVISEKEILDKILTISKKNLTDFAGKIISASKPNFSAIGKIKNLNDYQKIAQKFA